MLGAYGANCAAPYSSSPESPHRALGEADRTDVSQNTIVDCMSGSTFFAAARVRARQEAPYLQVCSLEFDFRWVPVSSAADRCNSQPNVKLLYSLVMGTPDDDISDTASADLMTGGEPELFMSRKRVRRTVSLRIFVIAVTGLSVALIILSLRCSSLDVPRPPASSLHLVNSYGLPDSLETVAPGNLVNKTQLDLDTGFVVTSGTTTREYEFNISIAYAAPDGFYKPMILVNGQSPGPLIEANNGDIIRVRGLQPLQRDHETTL